MFRHNSDVLTTSTLATVVDQNQGDIYKCVDQVLDLVNDPMEEEAVREIEAEQRWKQLLAERREKKEARRAVVERADEIEKSLKNYRGAKRMEALENVFGGKKRAQLDRKEEKAFQKRMKEENPLQLLATSSL